MTSILAALILSVIPQDDGVLRDAVDLVELNHFFNENAELVFDQLIWYDWSEEEGRFQVRAWRLVKDHAAMPIRQWFDKFDSQPANLLSGLPSRSSGFWVCLWSDGEVFREVTARSFKESFTQHDPELAEREFLPKEKRKELSSIKKRK